MSDSEKNDELDNYGVWVKKGPQTVDSSDSLATDFDIDTNLPDFSDLDLPEDPVADMAGSVDVTDAFLSDLDTDLSDLTGDASSEITAETEQAASGETEDISLDEFIAGGEFEDVAEGNRGYGQAEAPAPQKSAPAGGEESISLDDFLDMDSFGDAPAPEAAPAAVEEDAPLDIDLSFDDSADSLATATIDADVAVPEAPAKEEIGALAGTEAIDLSEFGFGDDSAEASAETAPAPEAAAEPMEAQPAEASADNFDDMFNAISEDTAIDASAFFDEPEAAAPAESAPTESAPAESAPQAGGEEEVDLSDFGFDDDSLAAQGEVKDDTRATPIGKVDYEMNVMADDDLPQEDAVPATPASAPEPAPTATASVPTSLDTGTGDDDFNLDALLDNVTDENGNTVQLTDTAPEATEAPAAPIAEETPAPAADFALDIPDTDQPADDVTVAETPAVDDIAIPAEDSAPEAVATEEPVSAFAVPEATRATPLAEPTDVAENVVAPEIPGDDISPAQAQTAAVPDATPVAPAAAQPAPSADGLASSAATAILSQIVGELTSLKNEIAGLKNDFEEMKNRDMLSASPTAATEDLAPVTASTGFFDDTGEDDTIALSTDELANIMNTADFETEQADEPIAESADSENVLQAGAPETESAVSRAIPDAPAFGDDPIFPAHDTGEPAEDSAPEIPEDDIPQADDAALNLGDDDTLSTDELANIMNTADFETEQADEPTDVFDTLNEPTADVSAEPTELTAASAEEAQNAPIAESAEIFAESAEANTTSDEIFADTAETLAETTEAFVDTAETLAESADGESVLHAESPETDSAFSRAIPDAPAFGDDAPIFPAPDTGESAEDSAPEIPEDDIPQADDAALNLGDDDTLSTDELANIMNTADFETEQADEPTDATESADDFQFDAINAGETVNTDLPEEISLPKLDDVIVEASETDDFAETTLAEEVKTNINDDSLDFLSSDASNEDIGTPEPASDFEAPPVEKITEVLEEAEPVAAPADTALTGDLKQEIKSVLSYMDKLLENLPEEKIAEFAQSEQFETYKKLFKELGLA